MRTFETPDALQKYRRPVWEHQRTFETPLNDLPRFVDVIMSALPEFTASVVLIEQVVFDPPDELVSLLTKHSLPVETYPRKLAIEAEDATEVRELLQAVLSEWIDFFLVPTPKALVIYADHDEYITFLAHRKGPLSRVAGALEAAKFRAVEYVREF